MPIPQQQSRSWRLLRLLAITLALAVVGAAEIKIAYEDEPEWPWVTAKQEGIDQVLLKRAAEKSGLALVATSLPRKRAFEQLKSGEIDGIINLSFKPERLEFLVYPMKGDKADAAQGLHVDSNAVYVKNGDPLTWDGKEFKGMTGAIGALAGHGSADTLKKMGLKVDDGAKSLLGQLEKLQRGRLQAAVLPTDPVKQLLGKNAELAKDIVALQPPFSTKASYLAFSKPFAAKSPETTAKLWTSIVEIRESEDFKAYAKDLIAKGE